MRGLVRGQGDEEIRSTATSLWLETVEERGWERASGELSRVSGGMAARAAHHRARLDEWVSASPKYVAELEAQGE